MAIEDAVQLAASVLRHGGTAPAALAHYERVRKERVTPIWEESTRQAVDYYKHLDTSANPMQPPRNMKAGSMFEFVRSYEAPCLSPDGAEVAAGASA